MSAPFLKIGDDLRLRIGDAEARLTPSQGLAAAEDLARKSFRRALAEEAEAPPAIAKPAKRRESR